MMFLVCDGLVLSDVELIYRLVVLIDGFGDGDFFGSKIGIIYVVVL